VALDDHLVAFLKLNHAVVGIYMCVRLHERKSAR
jgi:hypothetical protein